MRQPTSGRFGRRATGVATRVVSWVPLLGFSAHIITPLKNAAVHHSINCAPMSQMGPFAMSTARPLFNQEQTFVGSEC